MINSGDIRKDMRVIDADGVDMGAVDDVEMNAIKLKRSDSPDGHHHHVGFDQVARVDDHVHLNVRQSVVYGSSALGGDHDRDGSGVTGAIGAAAAGVGATVAAAGDKIKDVVHDIVTPDHDDATRTHLDRDAGLDRGHLDRDAGLNRDTHLGDTHRTGVTGGHVAGAAAAGAAALGAGAAAAGNRVVDALTPDTHTTHATGTHTTTTGVHGATPIDRDRDHVATPYVDPEPTRGPSILPWVLLGLGLLALLAWWFNRGTPEPVAAPAAVEAPAAATPGGVETVTLPGGASVELTPGTLTYDLQKFLASGDPAPKTFTFDKLNFATGSAAIRAEDQPTIDALAAIMAAYPNVKGRIVGYTDATGSAAANKALSARRSAAVVTALGAKGVAANRLTAEAGGIAQGAGGNDIGARRTDLVVTAK